MYIHDRQLPTLRSRRNEQAAILRPSQRYYYPNQDAFVMERYSRLGQSVPSPVSYNQPGQPLSPQSDYVLVPEVMDVVGTLLSTQVPGGHLDANPLIIERGVIIYRYDDGRLRVGNISFGTIGARTSAGTTRYSVKLEYHTFMDAGTGKVAYPWLYIHTHPAVQKFPEVPSGIYPENSKFVGDLYVLRNEPTRQIGIMTIGVNNVVTNFRNAPDPIPFTLAIRDPIKKGATDEKPTPLIHTHQAAATALRLMFPRSTVSGYYTGDLRTGRATPYLSVRQQRKETAKTGG
jgi:hypothetical protein